MNAAFISYEEGIGLVSGVTGGCKGLCGTTGTTGTMSTPVFDHNKLRGMAFRQHG